MTAAPQGIAASSVSDHDSPTSGSAPAVTIATIPCFRPTATASVQDPPRTSSAPTALAPAHEESRIQSRHWHFLPRLTNGRAVALCKGGLHPRSRVFHSKFVCRSQDPTIAATAQCTDLAASLAEPSQLRWRGCRLPPPFKHYRGHLAIKLFSLDSGIKEIDENENEDECQLLGFNLVLRYSNNMQTQSCFEMVHPRTPQSDYDSTK